MSLFASAGKSNKQLGQRIKQVRSVLEHIGLYVGLAVYTAAGAKVNQLGLLLWGLCNGNIVQTVRVLIYKIQLLI